MNNNFKIKNSKKGFLALETLLGLILSVIILFFIFQVFFNAFFQTPTNLKIAENNAKSIVEFVKNNFENTNLNLNCYNLLKLINLKNYQFFDENKNYFYIINNNGVYLIKLKNLEKILKEKKFINYIDKNYCFEKSKFSFSNNCKVYNKFDLYYDKTDQGWEFLGSSVLSQAANGIFFDLTNFGSFSDILKIEKDDIHNSFYIIIPKFGKTQKQNNYKIIYILNQDSSMDINGNYIYASDFKKDLFFSNGKISELLLNKNLCFLKNLEKKDIKNYYFKNPKKIDSIMNDIIISYKNNNIKNEISFEWRNRPICKKNLIKIDCKGLDNSLFKDYKNLDYITFIDKVIEFYKNNNDLPGISNLIVDIEEKPLSKIPKNKYLVFDVVFDKGKKVNEMYDKYINKDSSVGHYTMESSIFGINRFFNLCNFEKCNSVYLIEGDAYFYINKKNSFYKFNSFSFRKKEDLNSNDIKFYYLGKKVKFEKVTFDKVGEHLFDKKDFYIFKDIKVEDNNVVKNYDIVLSLKQVTRILEVEK